MAAEAPVGTTTVTVAPSFEAAKARPSPWLPADEATTARPGSCSSVAETAARPPRTLNDPVGWTVSTLTDTEDPSWGTPTTGVTAQEAAHRLPRRLPVGGPGQLHVAHRSSLAEARLAC